MVLIPPKPNGTVEAIYAAYEARQDEGWRAHLGASIIGTNCMRALWYSFHWATRISFSGRMLRLFQTGHKQEDRLVEDLRAIGVTVLEVDPETGRQWQVRDESGHFGGSKDGVAIGIPEAPKTWHLCEFKTSNIKGFEKLKKEGVQKAKPLHHAQMQTYMHMGGLERALYLAVCKDTDELYAERISADPEEGKRLVAKAHSIINSPTPLSRISNDLNWFECKWCDHKAICHGEAFPERNCRTCLHSTPVAEGRWHCGLHDMMLTTTQQREGCGGHLFIPQLVPGAQVDADEHLTWIEYRLTDGRVWRDEVE